MKDYQNNEGALVSQKPRKLIGNGKQSRETIAKIHDLHKTFSLTRDVMPPKVLPNGTFLFLFLLNLSIYFYCSLTDDTTRRP